MKRWKVWRLLSLYITHTPRVTPRLGIISAAHIVNDMQLLAPWRAPFYPPHTHTHTHIYIICITYMYVLTNLWILRWFSCCFRSLSRRTHHVFLLCSGCGPTGPVKRVIRIINQNSQSTLSHSLSLSVSLFLCNQNHFVVFNICSP